MWAGHVVVVSFFLLLLLGVVVRGHARGLFASLVVDPHSFSDFFSPDDPVETKKKVGERERERDTHTHTHTCTHSSIYIHLLTLCSSTIRLISHNCSFISSRLHLSLALPLWNVVFWFLVMYFQCWFGTILLVVDFSFVIVNFLLNCELTLLWAWTLNNIINGNCCHLFCENHLVCRAAFIYKWNWWWARRSCCWKKRLVLSSVVVSS